MKARRHEIASKAQITSKALPSTRNPDLDHFTPRNWQELVRKLVEQAEDDKIATKTEPNGRLPDEVVLFDRDVDGIRCLLLRQLSAEEPSVTFSPREREIARMIAKGLPNKSIAAVLEISTWTVCTHLRRIFAKLGVSSRAAAVARMMEMRLLQGK
jgi:two-component system, NarL family, nitrate/nitrite response regulator NarL